MLLRDAIAALDELPETVMLNVTRAALMARVVESPILGATQGREVMGTYVDSNLVKDERVVYETKPHWIVFISFRALFTLFIAPLIDYLTSEFAITNKRIIIKIGFISRRTLELNLSKVESVNVDQSILGRILGYGTIIVIGTGGTKEPFGDIREPLEFRKQFQQLSA